MAGLFINFRSTKAGIQMKTFYLTKYCLTFGIIPVNIDSKSKRKIYKKRFGEHLFASKAQAVKKAEFIREHKINLMNLQIEKMKQIDFNFGL